MTCFWRAGKDTARGLSFTLPDLPAVIRPRASCGARPATRGARRPQADHPDRRRRPGVPVRPRRAAVVRGLRSSRSRQPEGGRRDSRLGPSGGPHPRHHASRRRRGRLAARPSGPDAGFSSGHRADGGDGGRRHPPDRIGGREEGADQAGQRRAAALVPAGAPERKLTVASARTGSAACGRTGVRLACGLDRRPDPSLAAAPAARGSSPLGDSPRRVHAHLCRSPTLS